MTNDELRELIQIVMESGIAEIEIQRGEDRVRIKRAQTVQEYTVPAALPAPPPQTHSPVLHAPSVPAAKPPEPSNSLVKSPIVGTFYESASPGSPPFVAVGETVQPGKVLCIIESMKLMNEIEADIAGVITAKLVANGQPVEYGEALFGIRPL